MEERFRLLMESLPEAVVVVSSAGDVIYSNSRARRIFGSSIHGRKIWEIEGINAKKMEDFFQRLTKGGYLKKREVFEFLMGGRKLFFSIYATELIDKSGFILTFRDETAAVEAYKRIEELNEILRLISKLLRHDILNRITVARANLEILSDEIQSERIARAMEALDEATELIKRARSFEETLISGELLEMEILDVLDKIARQYRDRIEVRVYGSARVLADEAIYSVFSNLIDNSIKHGQSTAVEIRVEKRGEFAVITVKDNGSGIPVEIIDRIFEEGFSYGNKAGSGLGLYIVKKVIERYGGQIRAYNDNGAVFEIKLRLANS